MNANVGGKLNIESLQDEEHFKTKSSGGGLEIEFGFGNNWSISGYSNASSGKSNRKQVNEQAGIFAEDGGYHVDAQNVHLKGGAIASTNPNNSVLKTNSLTFEDIQNESSSKVASASISGSIKESKEKWVDNESGQKVKPHSKNSTFIPSQRSGGIGGGLPMYEQNNDSSITRATLTEGTIILNKDTNPTLTTAAQLGINTDLAQANSQVEQPKDVKVILAEQQQISAAIGNVKSAVETYTTNKQEEAEQDVRRLKSHLTEATLQGNQAAIDKLNDDIIHAQARAEAWGTGGSTKRAIDAITNAGLMALSGGSAQSIATSAASPYVNQLIKKATEDYPALNIPTHILWGAVEAELTGGKAQTGAIATAAGELGARYLTEHLYNKEAKDLTETERSQIKEMAKVLAGVAGGLAAAGQDASAVKILSESSIGMTVANNAVEYNWLTQEEVNQAKKAYQACGTKADPETCKRQIVRAVNELDSQRDIALGELNRNLELDYYNRIKASDKRYEPGSAQWKADRQKAYEDNVALRVKLMKEMFPKGMVTDQNSLRQLPNKLVIDKGFYPEGKFKEFYAGVKDNANSKVDSVSNYWKNNSAGQMAKDAWKGVVGVWDNVLALPENVYKGAKNWLSQDIPAHAIERKLDEITFSNAYEQGRLGFDATLGLVQYGAGGVVTSRLVGGTWQKVSSAAKASNNKLPLVGKTKGYDTTKVKLYNLEIEMSKQNKHLENTNEYKVSLANGQQKSIITAKLDSLKGYVGTGQQVGKIEIGLPGSKERVNFNKNIGIYIDPVTGNKTPTTIGIIHYSKNGYHIVPAKPKE